MVLASGINYTLLQDSLRLNTLEATISDPSDTLFSKSFKLLIRELKLWEYSTGQRMIYEGEEDIQESGLRNYFTNKIGRIPPGGEDTTWQCVRSLHSQGYMVKDAIPDDEYHFLQYGKKWYTAKYIVKMDTTGSGAKDTTKIADIIIYSKTLNAVDTMRILRRNNFTANNTFQTFELRFKVDSVSPPPNPPKRWDRLTGGAQSLTLYQEKIDLRVYWHGNVTMWLDKVIIEDDTAKALFAGEHDKELQQIALKYSNEVMQLDKHLYSYFPVSQQLAVDYIVHTLKQKALHQMWVVQ